MLYTRKGDKGLTGTFGCDQKMTKSSALAEALGAADELNSLLGVVKVAADSQTAKTLHQVQQNLFIIQAELAGAKKQVGAEKVAALEKIIDEIEKELPPVTTFLIAGGTTLAAQLDYARAVARRAERRVVVIAAERKISAPTLAYLNRLSSLLYALARLANHKAGIKEQAPSY